MDVSIQAFSCACFLFLKHHIEHFHVPVSPLCLLWFLSVIADGDCRCKLDLTGMVQGKLPCLRTEMLSEQPLDPRLFPDFLWAAGSLYCLSFSSCRGTSFLSGENPNWSDSGAVTHLPAISSRLFLSGRTRTQVLFTVRTHPVKTFSRFSVVTSWLIWPMVIWASF